MYLAVIVQYCTKERADSHCCDRLKCERQDKLKLCSTVNSGVVNLSTNFIVLYL